MGLTRKKRKGSEADERSRVVLSPCESRSSFSKIKAHYSMEDYARLKKRCKEGVADDKLVGSCKNRPAGVVTVPLFGASSLILPVRGLKRKIGCIDVATRLGRKKKIEDDYVLGGTIGHGKFGSVHSCRDKASGMEYACKTLKKGEEMVHMEVEIMQHLSGHPGIVTLQAVYEDVECFHLVMELCSGGHLVDRILKEGLCSEHRAANILKELLLVVKYCHDMGVVHRDIKPENILLTSSGKMKLADFGLATRLAKGQNLTGLAGSPAYVAPEVLLGEYSEKVDIWSIGILLHALLVGVLPFQGDSLKVIFEAIKNAELDFHTGKWETISKPARDLIERMLTRDVSARITADEALRHPWILFYTDRTLKTLSIKPKTRPSSGSPAVRPRVESWTSMEPESSGSAPSPQNSSCRLEEHDDCGLVDALAVAISQVRISEPKRSRLCGPVRAIQEQHSSNLTANALCRAF